MIDKCYAKAVEVIRACSTKHGLFASGGIDGYNAVWARDSMISFLGASLVKDKLFKETFKQSLLTLAKNQSKTGQIPNAVDKFSERKHHVDFASIDSSLWYIIGQYVYKKRYDDASLFRKHKKNTQKTLMWLRCQDTGEAGMLTQLPTSDWQDAFPHKYGYTINTQALYYKVLNLTGEKKNAERLKRTIDKDKDKKLWNGGFYDPYRWKNHNKYQEVGDWFDSLGNLLAIIFDLADKLKAKKILSYVEKTKINKPYPVKAIHPPIQEGSKYWHDYFLDSDAGKPNSYLNGGIWTYIGAFYVLSLIKIKSARAKIELERLAKANLDGNFAEWIHPETKEHFGKLQAWNAGMYILAYESVKKNKLLL